MKTRLLIFFSFFTLALAAQTVTVKTDLVYKVNLPAQPSDKTPVLIMLHGYGSNESDLFDISKSIDGRFITFSIRGPLPARGQGFAWYGLEYVDGKRTHDYLQAKESRAKILSFISAACKAYKLDSSQVYLMGFSQGAIMSMDIALSKPEKIKGVLALSGLLMEETKKIKTDPVKLSKVRFFIAHGTQDNIIDYKEGETASKLIQEKKAQVTFKSYAMPHSISGQELNDIKSWLKTGIEKKK